MRMKKRKFRIGELAEQLNVERFVIRFCEKEFKIKTIRSSGGQRFYQEKDHVRLQPANSIYNPIRTRKVVIQGKVKGVIRKFQ